MRIELVIQHNDDFEIFAIAGDRFFKPMSKTSFTIASAAKYKGQPSYFWSVHFMSLEDGEVFEGANISGSEGHTTLQEALNYARIRAADEAGVKIA